MIPKVNQSCSEGYFWKNKMFLSRKPLNPFHFFSILLLSLQSLSPVPFFCTDFIFCFHQTAAILLLSSSYYYFLSSFFSFALLLCQKQRAQKSIASPVSPTSRDFFLSVKQRTLLSFLLSSSSLSSIILCFVSPLVFNLKEAQIPKFRN